MGKKAESVLNYCIGQGIDQICFTRTKIPIPWTQFTIQASIYFDLTQDSDLTCRARWGLGCP